MTKTKYKSACCNAGTYKTIQAHKTQDKSLYICKQCGGVCKTE
ncbi:hypothetical protein BN863_28840 [Formosa agariphila KMM 3901]|uniref:Uncharacterized protein n=1 Tax=Formosa agariphila (strain DSM 15362 / KCTC 12365 / LMG 23005 / KMM 3901 / M-2Alg 35-1) TaxID=1347342 RepID=T2KQ64_FORAG|nr:hypothetical protein BN863_28840 [Formosa agariphila KMM 3901]